MVLTSNKEGEIIREIDGLLGGVRLGVGAHATCVVLGELFVVGDGAGAVLQD